MPRYHVRVTRTRTVMETAIISHEADTFDEAAEWAAAEAKDATMPFNAVSAEVHGVATREVNGEYSDAEMRRAFELVEDKTDWKCPIDTILSPPVNEALLSAAIGYFTATKPRFIPMAHGRVRVVADGYRAGPAGDH